MISGPVGPAPMWVRVAATVVPRAPVGRYRMAHALRHLAGAPFLMRLPAALGGYAFHCDIRDCIAREVCFTGLYEPQETRIAAALVAPGMTVVDVGANWGYFTLAASHWVGRAGRVVAFEPEPRLFAMLEANLRRNNLVQADGRRVAIAAGPNVVRLRPFDEASGNWGTSKLTDTADGTLCEAGGLDHLLDREGIGVVDLLKIDVEGAEADVVAGMRAGIASRRYRSILLECHPAALRARGRTVAECLEPLLASEYRALTIDHSPSAHRRAAASAAGWRDLLRPVDGDVRMDEWPHFLAVAPGRSALDR
jgi:FkbM family methyltransferase